MVDFGAKHLSTAMGWGEGKLILEHFQGSVIDSCISTKTHDEKTGSYRSHWYLIIIINQTLRDCLSKFKF